MVIVLIYPQNTMNPLVWGPPFWFVMHTVSLNYPVRPTYANRRTHYDFFYIIRNILPCEMCRQHYRMLLKQFPIEPFLDNRDSLISWVILIHNQVNIRLGKPTMTKEDVLQKYHHAYERQSFCKLPHALQKGNTPSISSDVVGSHMQDVDVVQASNRTNVVALTVFVTMVVTILLVMLVLYVLYRRYRGTTLS